MMMKGHYSYPRNQLIARKIMMIMRHILLRNRIRTDFKTVIIKDIHFLTLKNS